MRCEDFPCCGHPADEGCEDRPEFTMEFWLEKMKDPDYDEYYDEAR